MINKYLSSIVYAFFVTALLLADLQRPGVLNILLDLFNLALTNSDLKSINSQSNLSYLVLKQRFCNALNHVNLFALTNGLVIRLADDQKLTKMGTWCSDHVLPVLVPPHPSQVDSIIRMDYGMHSFGI